MPVKHCPECGRENDLDSLRCIRCGVALPGPEESPPGAEPEARSVVLATFDNHLSAQAAANHLEDAGIPVVVNADDCGGFYPFLTPALGIRLLVKASDLPRAREEMAEIAEQFGIKAGSAGVDTGELMNAPRPPHKPTPHLTKLGFLLLGAVMGALSHYAWTVHQSLYTGTVDRDLNGDGRADAWWTYRKGELISSSLDRNFDGKPDQTSFFREGGR